MRLEVYEDKWIRLILKTVENSPNSVENIGIAWWVYENQEWKCNAPGFVDFIPLTAGALGIRFGGSPYPE